MKTWRVFVKGVWSDIEKITTRSVQKTKGYLEASVVSLLFKHATFPQIPKCWTLDIVSWQLCWADIPILTDQGLPLYSPIQNGLGPHFCIFDGLEKIVNPCKSTFLLGLSPQVSSVYRGFISAHSWGPWRWRYPVHHARRLDQVDRVYCEKWVICGGERTTCAINMDDIWWHYGLCVILYIYDFMDDHHGIIIMDHEFHLHGWFLIIWMIYGWWFILTILGSAAEEPLAL